VFIILSQMTTHQSFNRVFDRLKRAYPSWEAVLAYPRERLQKLIADAGLSAHKAPRIYAILERIRADFRKVSLAPLHSFSDLEAERYLCSLPGVGEKTAKCVLMFSLGRAVLPVDTHVWRLGRRLGLIDSTVSLARAHQLLERVVPVADRYTLHVNALDHGRQVCRALRPRCPVCVLRSRCPSAPRSSVASEHPT